MCFILLLNVGVELQSWQVESLIVLSSLVYVNLECPERVYTLRTTLRFLFVLARNDCASRICSEWSSNRDMPNDNRGSGDLKKTKKYIYRAPVYMVPYIGTFCRDVISSSYSHT